MFSDRPTLHLHKEDADQWHFKDFPEEGNTLVAEYCPLNHPSFAVWIEPNKAGELTARKAIKELEYKGV